MAERWNGKVSSNAGSDVDGNGNIFINTAFDGSEDTSLPHENSKEKNTVVAIPNEDDYDRYDDQTGATGSLHSVKSASDSVSKRNRFSLAIDSFERHVCEFFANQAELLKTLFYSMLVVGYAAYFGYALYYDFEGESSIRLLWITMAVVVSFAICIVQDHFGAKIYANALEPIVDFVTRYWKVFKIGFILVVSAAYVAFLVVSVGLNQPYNLISFGGLLIYLLLMFLYSADRRAILWRPVLWGLLLQFIFGLLVLRTTFGYEAFKWIGDRVQEYMAYSDEGAKFVFGDSFEDHFFAFKILSVVIYFSATISTLYYLGVMQVVILKISWLMEKTLGTSPGESVNAAGNIFIGQTESPLLIKPLLPDMTESELHAVITGGYATIAGSVMASYIAFGVPANHLISASIMAAPCALGISKLCYPETQKRKKDVVATLANSTECNFVEAAAAGAIAAIPLAANIAANLIAFISLLAFVNTTLTWFGHRVGLYEPELTFEFICSYAMWPLAFVMGVASNDCRKVGELIGVKVFLNEFVAFKQLSVYISNTETFNAYTDKYGGNWTQVNDDVYLTNTNTTLVGGIMQHRSSTISTYALCGFANISSIGAVIGALSAMVPQRRSEIARLATRAMIVGNVVCFMNACTAGLLYQETL